MNSQTPPQVDVPSMLNVAVEYVDGAVASGHGDRVAYIYEKEQVTFGELRNRVNQAGNALAALGVEIEQRVAILLPNRPEFVTSFFGAIKIGAVPTLISFAVTPDAQRFLVLTTAGDEKASTPMTVVLNYAQALKR
jgi:acyl-coenzyme A synthetase/AMP-(fatty) acid ligase